MQGPDLTTVRPASVQGDMYQNSADRPDHKPPLNPEQHISDAASGDDDLLDTDDTTLPAAGMRDGGMPGSQLDE